MWRHCACAEMCLPMLPKSVFYNHVFFLGWCLYYAAVLAWGKHATVSNKRIFPFATLSAQRVIQHKKQNSFYY
jgi:hypothetical protein